MRAISAVPNEMVIRDLAAGATGLLAGAVIVALRPWAVRIRPITLQTVQRDVASNDVDDDGDDNDDEDGEAGEFENPINLSWVYVLI